MVYCYQIHSYKNKMADTTKNEIVALLKEIKRDGIENLIEFLERTDFYTAPASTKFHNAFEGGLAEHSLNVYKALKELTGEKWSEDTLRIVGLLHDVCKINLYIYVRRGIL